MENLSKNSILKLAEIIKKNNPKLLVVVMAFRKHNIPELTTKEIQLFNRMTSRR